MATKVMAAKSAYIQVELENGTFVELIIQPRSVSAKLMRAPGTNDFYAEHDAAQRIEYPLHDALCDAGLFPTDARIEAR